MHGGRSGCCLLCPTAWKAKYFAGDPCAIHTTSYTAPSPPSQSRESWHLDGWCWAHGVKSFTLLYPVQKGDKNQHASSPGEQGGRIHLAERGGSLSVRGAGISAERINLQ